MTVVAAGTVLWRRADNARGLEVGLVHRPKYDDWSLPKGKQEAGEHVAVTAVRETREETGHDGALGRALGEVRYDVQTSHGPDDKVVHYWAMEALGGAFTPSSEVDRLLWLPPDDARALLTRPADRDPVDALLAAPAATATVLLVRHGHAGSRKTWKGPDDARPLDAAGRAEAAALAAALPAWGPVVVGAAVPLRCAQTLQPLAEALGAPVEAMPALSESVYDADPGAARDLVLELAGSGRTAAVCSQGGVIPGLLRTLADRRTRRPRHRQARKGSVWVLSFAGADLVAADYFSDLRT